MPGWPNRQIKVQSSGINFRSKYIPFSLEKIKGKIGLTISFSPGEFKKKVAYHIGRIVFLHRQAARQGASDTDFLRRGSFLLCLGRLHLSDEFELTNEIEIALAQNLIARDALIIVKTLASLDPQLALSNNFIKEYG